MAIILTAWSVIAGTPLDGAAGAESTAPGRAGVTTTRSAPVETTFVTSDELVAVSDSAASDVNDAERIRITSAADAGGFWHVFDKKSAKWRIARGQLELRAGPGTETDGVPRKVDCIDARVGDYRARGVLVGAAVGMAAGVGTYLGTRHEDNTFDSLGEPPYAAAIAIAAGTASGAVLGSVIGRVVAKWKACYRGSVNRAAEERNALPKGGN